jgi:hypothetical protein
VLFILSRSITDVSVSSKSEEAVRAFSAAEAGIEQALVTGASQNNITIGNASYTSSVIQFAEGAKEYVYPLELSSGDSTTTWFAAHDKLNANFPVCDASHACFTGNTMKVCWGKPGTAKNSDITPAIEVSVFYETTPGDLSSIKIARTALDPYNGRNPANSFSLPDNTDGGCSIGGNTYQFSKTILFSGLGIPATAYNVRGGLLFARTRMMYTTSSQNFAVSVDFPGNIATGLPSQGQNVVSTGSAGPDLTASQRKINVFQSWPEIPSVLEFAVYSGSGTGLTKGT